MIIFVFRKLALLQKKHVNKDVNLLYYSRKILNQLYKMTISKFVV